MLADNPILTVLGRRGRGAVIQQLVQRPQTWSVRGLARAAGVAPATAARTIQELEALAAVEVLRVGREAKVRFLASRPVGDVLARLRLPDVRAQTAKTFALTMAAAPGMAEQPLLWNAPGDSAADPACPTRLALLGPDPEALLERAGPALDAVREAGWPAPEVTAWDPRELDPRDPVAAAILRGTPITA